MIKNITDYFVEDIVQLSQKDIPEKVKNQAKMSVIDYVACTYLGESMLRDQNQKYLNQLSGDIGNSIIVGAHKKTTTYAAAMINGINSHVAELDDGHRYGMMHLAAPIITPLLAVAQSHKIEGIQFIKGIVIGYEVAIRLASSIQPGHKLKGYHATGTCGTIGAAVGIAVALNYTSDQIKAVISAAVTDAAGILEVIDDGSQLKPYNIGRAAVAAINASYIGASGLVGPDDILGGKRGFFKVMAQDVNLSYVKDGFEDKYAIELIYRKPYAACRHCHAAIEAAMNVSIENNISIDDIADIKVETYGLAVNGHDHIEVRGTSSAKMSTPYSVAVALVYGKADFQQFEEACIEDSRTNEIMKKVMVLESEELSALVPNKRGAIVTIKTSSQEFTNRVDYPKGEPENPINKEELEQKFYSLLKASGKDEMYAKEILSKIWNIEEDIETLISSI